MKKKKVRGLKRKTKKMVRQIREYTLEFPERFVHPDYWHMHLPVAQDFINATKTPRKVKRCCIQTFIDQVSHLRERKPDDGKRYRVVAAISLPDLWSSQIIIFKGDSYFRRFFDRKHESQTWIPFSKERDLKREWDLHIPESMQVLGFKEVMIEENYRYEGELWFIGELT